MALTDKELIVKAMQCETPEELVELAKAEGVELTLEEAEAYLAEMDDLNSTANNLKRLPAACALTIALATTIAADTMLIKANFLF